MSQTERRYHENWMGMVQPIEGLVFSVPVLIDAQVMDRTGSIERQETFLGLCVELDATDDEAPATAAPIEPLLTELLGFQAGDFDRGAALPEDLLLWVPEGRQLIKPTLALRKTTLSKTDEDDGELEGIPDDSTPQSRAGEDYEMLVWQVPDGLDLDKPETETGTWEYPASAKFERLLRAVRVPIGLLCNGEVVRLVYAPHGESSGTVTFRIADMATIGGRPILDAFDALLCAERVIGMRGPDVGGDDWPLSCILRESRKRQANVTNDLADQVYDALEILLHGFENAAERDGWTSLSDALTRDDDHVYGGLLTVLLRLVFVLYAEDRGLLPVDRPLYAQHLSLLALFEQLQEDHGSYPDSMGQRFSAWPRLIALFRSIFLGVSHGDARSSGLVMPARRGQLFDPNEYPFLEGWHAGSAPIKLAEHRAATHVPSVDDGTVYEVLRRLLLLDGQRLSYRALDVEQIGSVYEALMGYHVMRLATDAVCLKAAKARGGVWVELEDVLATAKNRRVAELAEETGQSKSKFKKIDKELKAAADAEELVGALEPLRRKVGRELMPLAKAGRLVIQPGKERRRTSSHYTPPSLTTPIVKRTLEPLLKVMGDEPAADRLLNLKICDPAMGSGAFLVAVVKFLADQVVAAWTREGRVQEFASGADDVVHVARRLVAQRCVYGVDKNPYAVNLAKLSLWLTTLAKDEPFTFLDHALRHGDSLVGLDLDQIRAFTWEKEKGPSQVDWCANAIASGLEEAMAHRRDILAMATDKTPDDAREKERLLQDAEFAIGRARLIADVIVGAFFAEKKDKDRKKELSRRMTLVQQWLDSDEPANTELLVMQEELREQTPAFHWPLEFPEVFWEERPDPLDDDQVNRAADMDAFVGNPPFAGKNGISETNGPLYLDWLKVVHHGAHGNADLSAHFYRRATHLLGLHGCFGLIATNTIAQGDTRTTGLQQIVGQGGLIYDATQSFKWPGVANVAVGLAHVALGSVSAVIDSARLDGRIVPVVNSRFRPTQERPDPVTLRANANKSFQGSIVLGMGFTLTPEERDALVAKDRNNAERIFPYLGGKEVNTSPTQSHDRYVINFGDMDLGAAEQWPDLVGRVRELVKPEREKNNRANYRDKWWQFGELRPGLYKGIASIERCIVCSRHSKHLSFARMPTDRVFSEATNVFVLEGLAHFATLQSRIHEVWARLLSSSMRNDLRYATSDCFETFPFPPDEAFAPESALNTIGRLLDETRTNFMTGTDQGLTTTYNLLKDPGTGDDAYDGRIGVLRALHVEMDRAVLDAYGWGDIEVPPFVDPVTKAEKEAREAFADEVIDRLFALNAERAAEEAKAREPLLKSGGKKKARKRGSAKGTGKKQAKAEKQGDLF